MPWEDTQLFICLTKHLKSYKNSLEKAPGSWNDTTVSCMKTHYTHLHTSGKMQYNSEYDNTENQFTADVTEHVTW